MLRRANRTEARTRGGGAWRSGNHGTNKARGRKLAEARKLDIVRHVKAHTMQEMKRKDTIQTSGRGSSADRRGGPCKQVHQQTTGRQWLHARGRAGESGLQYAGVSAGRNRNRHGRPRHRHGGRRRARRGGNDATTLHGAGVVTAGIGKGGSHGQRSERQGRDGGENLHLTGTGSIRGDGCS